MSASNGMPAEELRAVWQKSSRSNPSGEIAVRNSRHSSGPALVYTRAEVSAFFAGVKDGEFDDLI